MSKDARTKIVTIAVIALGFGIVAAKQLGWRAPESVSGVTRMITPGPPREPEPRDVIYRMLDAARDGDAEAYIDCYSGEMRRMLEQTRAEMSPAGFQKYLTERNRQIKGIAINEPKQRSEAEAEVRVEYVYQDRNEAQELLLRKQQGEWKIARVSSTERVPTLVPYGTPVY